MEFSQLTYLNEDGERVQAESAIYAMGQKTMESGYIAYSIKDLRVEYEFESAGIYVGDSNKIRRRGLMALALSDELWRREHGI